MSGTFSSINTALTALRYNQIAMDVASGNIANVGTEGYARRRVQAESAGTASIAALWSRSDISGEGVRATGIQRMTDPFLDLRARYEHGSQSSLDVRQAVLDRLEAGIGEPGDNGVAAAIARYRSAWHDVANDPGGAAARSQLLAQAATVVDAFRVQDRNISTEAGDQRAKLQAMVTEVNTVASDLATANTAIAAAKLNGTDAGSLLDGRDVLAMRLSELTGAVASGRPDGGFDVSINGVSLVNGSAAGTLQISSGITASGGADGSAVTFSITDAAGTSAATVQRGEAGAVTELLNTTLPGYADGLAAVAQAFADQVNSQHAAGYDANGTAGTEFFTYTAGNAAGTLALGFDDAALIAASSVSGGELDGGNAALLGVATSAEGDYQRLVNGFGTQVASVRRLALNQQNLTAQVDGSREQLSGISLDEETLSLLAAQHAYEAAARVITTIDSVLDTLINRTGVTR